MILTANQKRQLRHLWKGELTYEEIADEMGFSQDLLGEAVLFLGLPDRDTSNVFMPTSADIRLAAAKIRAEWSQDEREDRLKAATSARMATGADKHHDATGRSADGADLNVGPAHRQKRRQDDRG